MSMIDADRILSVTSSINEDQDSDEREEEREGGRERERERERCVEKGREGGTGSGEQEERWRFDEEKQKAGLHSQQDTCCEFAPQIERETEEVEEAEGEK